MTEDVFDHYHRRVHDDAEINCANRQEIRRVAPRIHDQHTEEQRDRYCCRHDDRTSQITEEDKLDDEDQDDPEHNVVYHGLSGDVDQVAPVIEGLDLDACRKQPGVVDLVNFRRDSLDYLDRVFATPHQHDAFNDVRVCVAPGDAQPLGVPDFSLGDIFQINRGSSGLREHNVIDVVERADQADAPHVR